MQRKYLVLSFLMLVIYCLPAQESMDNAKIQELLENTFDKVEGVSGNWQVICEQRVLFILTNEPHNRMRIFTPVINQKELKKGEMESMLNANFHAALDAKYALYGEFVVSLFTHPLREIQIHQFLDALKQVATAANNFGTTFSSTDIIFGGNSEKANDSDSEKKINQKPGKKS